MLDQLIKGGTVVDGTGAPARVADVGVRDGRIVAIGEVTEEAAAVIDATGLLVIPGIIDPHTHYDAQLFWDGGASPSNVHGVTTVIGGNCGFTLAPLKAEDAAYTREFMASVEGMSVAALEEGVPWNWESFAEYLDQLDGKVGVNAGFLVGHNALRRYVMGPGSVGNEATPEEVAAMQSLLAESIQAGGLGFSTTLSRTHSDGDGQPVASRWATNEEILALCEVVEQHPGTTLEAMTDGCLDRFSDEEIELFSDMSATAKRPLNWNVMTIDSREPGRIPRQLSAGDRAAEKGGRIVALTLPVQVPMNMSFLNHCGLFLIPGWKDLVLGLPVPERIAKLQDPDVQAQMQALSQAPEAGVFKRLADFENYILGDTYSEANEGLKGRRVGDLAAERGQEAFATLIDVVVADELRTVLWPIPPDGDADSWELRRQTWADDRAMLGGSDAGAHLDRMCGAPFPTRFLGDTLRGRKLVPVERAVQLMTEVPATLFGLRDRGLLVEGFHADITIVDPETVGSELAELVHDLPGDSPRLTADSIGVVRVLVNGTVTVVDGKPTGELPGTVLRSGRDTDTVATS
ncbi:amidohydrolase family protein [Aquihabitans sp. G128]|uniref:N-acyl-D-amino-acid deacylase family protein n=1 Tax=Aquihabitans sp. G128 TaxID=2849779 RepID=UPI001C225E4D|nr:amidohydrolase family protein [Aquihabitans sp. G128]QXC60383.1 amidohydrolase family protein [Aquihabitans sp. G128]